MFNQIFNKKVLVPFFQFLGVIGIFEWIIFPGLTAADTIVNVFSVIIGFFTLLAFYYVVKSWFVSDEPIVESKKTTKKSNPKQMDGVESDKPFVKTRKKATTKKTK